MTMLEPLITHHYINDVDYNNKQLSYLDHYFIFILNIYSIRIKTILANLSDKNVVSVSVTSLILNNLQN